MSQLNELPQSVYGNLTVLNFTHSKHYSAYFDCVCTCGTVVNVRGHNLISGNTVSCGCFNKQKLVKHANTRHPLYYIWKSMKLRCENPKHESYKKYGAKGIKVCAKWQDFNTFAADMGKRPSINHSIDRKDGTKGYSKDNCKWATIEEQIANRRPYIPNKVLGTKQWLRKPHKGLENG